METTKSFLFALGFTLASLAQLAAGLVLVFAMADGHTVAFTVSLLLALASTAAIAGFERHLEVR